MSMQFICCNVLLQYKAVSAQRDKSDKTIKVKRTEVYLVIKIKQATGMSRHQSSILHYSNRTYFCINYIGVGDGGRGAVAPKFGQKLFFSGKNRVKFGHFVNFSCIYFRAKMSCPPKLTELLYAYD